MAYDVVSWTVFDFYRHVYTRDISKNVSGRVGKAVLDGHKPRVSESISPNMLLVVTDTRKWGSIFVYLNI